MKETAARLVDYYDRNTGLFLRLGASGSARAIHRGLWGEGVQTAEAAAQYIHTLIREVVARLSVSVPDSILDLGCGVGGTVLALAEHYPQARLLGVSLSPLQIAHARRFAQKDGCSDRCTFLEADFHALPITDRFDLVIMIEALAHSPSPGQVLQEVRTHLSASGLFIVVDDFLAQPEATLATEQLPCIARFRESWQLPGLLTVEQCMDQARERGFRLAMEQDLSGWIRLNRLRDHCVALSAPVAERLGGMRHPFWANVIGGNALRQGLRQGVIQYRLLVLQAPD